MGWPLTKEAIPFQKADCYFQLVKDCSAAAKAKKEGKKEKLALFQTVIKSGEEAIDLFDKYEKTPQKFI